MWLPKSYFTRARLPLCWWTLSIVYQLSVRYCTDYLKDEVWEIASRTIITCYAHNNRKSGRYLYTILGKHGLCFLFFTLLIRFFFLISIFKTIMCLFVLLSFWERRIKRSVECGWVRATFCKPDYNMLFISRIGKTESPK